MLSKKKNTGMLMLIYRKLCDVVSQFFTRLMFLLNHPIVFPSVSLTRFWTPFFTWLKRHIGAFRVYLLVRVARTRHARYLRRTVFTYMRRVLRKLDPTSRLRAFAEVEEIVYLGKVRRFFVFIFILARKIFWLSWKETKKDLLYVLTLGRYGRDVSPIIVQQSEKLLAQTRDPDQDVMPIPPFVLENPKQPFFRRVKTKCRAKLNDFFDFCLTIFFLPIFFPSLWKNFLFKLDYWAYTVSYYGIEHFTSLAIITLHYWNYIPSNFPWYQRGLHYWKGFTVILFGMTTFLRASIVFRLEDLRLPSFVELGYPISWANPRVLYRAMYQQDGFFLWTLKRDFDQQLFQRILEHYQLPLYLRDPVANGDMSQFLLTLRSQTKDQLSETAFSTLTKIDYSIKEAYLLFFDSLRYTLLEELQKDPLFILRICLADCTNPQLYNPYTDYIYNGQLLDQVFSKWSVLVHGELPISVEVSFGSLKQFFTSDLTITDHFWVFLLRNGFCTAKHYNWWLGWYELFAETFILVLPYEFFLGKFILYHNMLLPFWVLWSKSTLFLAPWYFFPIYAACGYYYYFTWMQVWAQEDHFFFNEQYWQFRLSCWFYTDLDPDDEDDFDLLFCLLIWFLLPFYFDWLRGPYLCSVHTSSQRRKKIAERLFWSKVAPILPDYRRFLVRRNRGRHQGQYDYFLRRMHDDLSPVTFVQTFLADHQYRYRLIYRSMRTKGRNDRNFFIAPGLSILDAESLVRHIEHNRSLFKPLYSHKLVNEFITYYFKRLTKGQQLYLSEQYKTVEQQTAIYMGRRPPRFRMGKGKRNPYFFYPHAFYCGRGRRDPETGAYFDRKALPQYSVLRTKKTRIGLPLLVRHWKSHWWEVRFRYWKKRRHEDYSFYYVHRFIYDLEYSVKPYTHKVHNKNRFRKRFPMSYPPQSKYHRFLMDFEWRFIFSEFDKNFQFENLFTSPIPLTLSFSKRRGRNRALQAQKVLANMLQPDVNSFSLKYYGIADSEQDVVFKFIKRKDSAPLFSHRAIATGPAANLFFARTRNLLQRRSWIESQVFLNDFFDPVYRSPAQTERSPRGSRSQVAHNDQVRTPYIINKGTARHHPKDILIARKWLRIIHGLDQQPETSRHSSKMFHLEDWLFTFFDKSYNRENGLISFYEHNFLSTGWLKFARPNLKQASIRRSDVIQLYLDPARVTALLQDSPELVTLPYRLPRFKKSSIRRPISSPSITFSLTQAYISLIDEYGPTLSVFLQDPHFFHFIVKKYDDLAFPTAYNLERPLPEIVAYLNSRYRHLGQYHLASFECFAMKGRKREEAFWKQLRTLKDQKTGSSVLHDYLFPRVEIEVSHDDLLINQFYKGFPSARSAISPRTWRQYYAFLKASQSNQQHSFFPFSSDSVAEDISYSGYLQTLQPHYEPSASCNSFFGVGVFPHPTISGEWLPFSFSVCDEDLAYQDRMKEVLSFFYYGKLEFHLTFHRVKTQFMDLDSSLTKESQDVLREFVANQQMDFGDSLSFTGVLAADVIPEVSLDLPFPAPVLNLSASQEVSLEVFKNLKNEFLTDSDKDKEEKSTLKVWEKDKRFRERHLAVRYLLAHLNGHGQKDKFTSEFIAYSQLLPSEEIRSLLKDRRFYTDAPVYLWSTLEQLLSFYPHLKHSALTDDWDFHISDEPLAGNLVSHPHPLHLLLPDIAKLPVIRRLVTLLEELTELRDQARIKYGPAAKFNKQQLKLVNEFFNLLLLSPEEQVDLKVFFELSEQQENWLIHPNLKLFDDDNTSYEREALETLQLTEKDIDPLLDEMRRHIDELEHNDGGGAYRATLAPVNELNPSKKARKAKRDVEEGDIDRFDSLEMATSPRSPLRRYTSEDFVFVNAVIRSMYNQFLRLEAMESELDFELQSFQELMDQPSTYELHLQARLNEVVDVQNLLFFWRLAPTDFPAKIVDISPLTELSLQEFELNDYQQQMQVLQTTINCFLKTKTVEVDQIPTNFVSFTQEQLSSLLEYLGSFEKVTMVPVSERFLTSIQRQILRHYRFHRDEFDEIYKMLPICVEKITRRYYLKHEPTVFSKHLRKYLKKKKKKLRFNWQFHTFYHDRALVSLHEDLYVTPRDHYIYWDKSLTYDDPDIDDTEFLMRERRLSNEDILWQLVGTRYTWKLRHPSYCALKDQALLRGVYGATQLIPTDRLFLLQLSSLYTSDDLFPTYMERTLGLEPIDWFDVFDESSQTLFELAPNARLPFKDSVFLGSEGYQRYDTTLPKVRSKFSIIDNIDSITTGFTQLEQLVGVEFAVVYYTQTYFGMSPTQFLEMFLYGSYWMTNWLHLIYDVCFRDPNTLPVPPTVHEQRPASQVFDRGGISFFDLLQPQDQDKTGVLASRASQVFGFEVRDHRPATYSYLDRMPYISPGLIQRVARFYQIPSDLVVELLEAKHARIGQQYLASFFTDDSYAELENRSDNQSSGIADYQGLLDLLGSDIPVPDFPVTDPRQLIHQGLLDLLGPENPRQVIGFTPEGHRLLRDGTRVTDNNTRYLPNGGVIHSDNSLTFPEVDRSRFIPGSQEMTPDGRIYRADGSFLTLDWTIQPPFEDLAIPALINQPRTPAVRVLIWPETDVTLLQRDIAELRSRVDPRRPIVLWNAMADRLRGVIDSNGQTIMPYRLSGNGGIDTIYQTVVINGRQVRLVDLGTDFEMAWFATDQRRPLGVPAKLMETADFRSRWKDFRLRYGEVSVILQAPTPPIQVEAEVVFDPRELPKRVRRVRNEAEPEQEVVLEGPVTAAQLKQLAELQRLSGELTGAGLELEGLDLVDQIDAVDRELGILSDDDEKRASPSRPGTPNPMFEETPARRRPLTEPPVLFIGGSFGTSRQYTNKVPRGTPLLLFTGADEPLGVSGTNGPVFFKGKTSIVVDGRRWTVADLIRLGTQELRRRNLAGSTTNAPLIFENGELVRQLPQPASIRELRPIFINSTGRRFPIGDADDTCPVYMAPGDEPTVLGAGNRDIRGGRPVFMLDSEKRPRFVMGVGPSLRKIPLTQEFVVIHNKVYSVAEITEYAQRQYSIYAHPFIQLARNQIVGPHNVGPRPHPVTGVWPIGPGRSTANLRHYPIMFHFFRPSGYCVPTPPVGPVVGSLSIPGRAPIVAAEATEAPSPGEVVARFLESSLSHPTRPSPDHPDVRMSHPTRPSPDHPDVRNRNDRSKPAE